MPSRFPKPAILLALGALALTSGLAGCGVRGAPAVPPPLFGDTDLPPGVPQPYQTGPRPALPASIPPQPTDVPPGEDD